MKKSNKHTIVEKLIRAFTYRKRANIFFLVTLVICGCFSYISIPREESPDIKVPIIYTFIKHTGISPEDSERLLLKPMESAFRSVSGIKELRSYAYEGSGVIIAKFYAGYDTDKALSDIRAKVDDTERELPDGTDKPTVREVNLSLLPVLNVILMGDIPETDLIKIARKLRDKIEIIQDVLSVTISGDREDVVEVLVEPKTLEFYGLNLSQVSQIIKRNNALIAVGKVRNKGGTFSVKLPATVEKAEDLYEFPILNHNNTVIKLRDIAEIRKTYKDPKYIARVNGKPTIVLEIAKRMGANIISTVKEVKEVIKNEQQFLPNNLNILYSQDASQRIINVVDDLENGILLAVILVSMVVVFCVGGRSALLVGLSIPAAFLIGVLFLDVLGCTLNIVVLFSLILTVGMIVDDAIVVSEYADRRVIEGMDIKEAFINSATRMFWPVITSTLVKLLVFLPLLFWPDLIGKFMKFMPITVIAILTNSMLFALFFQPSIGALFGTPKKPDISVINAMKAAEDGSIKDLKGFTKQYYYLLEKVLNKPKAFVFSLFGLLVVVYAFFGFSGTGVEFFPKIEPESALLAIESRGDLSIIEKDKIAKSVEDKIIDMTSEVDVFYTKSGDFETDNSVPKGTIGVIELELADWKVRRKSNAIFADMKKRITGIDGIKAEILLPGSGPSASKPISINFTSRDFSKVPSFVKKVKKAMDEMGGFKGIEDSGPLSGIDWFIDMDRERMGMYSINADEIGRSLNLLSDGFKASSFRPDYTDDEVDIVIRFKPEYRKTTEIDKLKVINSKNQAISLSNFAKKRAGDKINSIKRVNRKNVVAIKADVQEGVLANDKVHEIRKWLEKNNEEGIEYEFKGENEDQTNATHFLIKAFSLAFLMMFVVMLIQFNSFYHTIVVMSAVFLSTVGVLVGLIITWQPFGIVMCGVGIIALSGIVLNNNILFIDTYQHLRKNGHDVRDAVIRAGIQRMRPILLTATTAILGLLPMIFGITINFFTREVTYDAPSSQWWRQLSTSIAGGLSFATILTLFCTPCLLLIGAKLDPFRKNEKA